MIDCNFKDKNSAIIVHLKGNHTTAWTKINRNMLYNFTIFKNLTMLNNHIICTCLTTSYQDCEHTRNSLVEWYLNKKKVTRTTRKSACPIHPRVSRKNTWTWLGTFRVGRIKPVFSSFKFGYFSSRGILR